MTGGRPRSKAGFVYVLSNPAMPGIVKIGMTQRDPDVRLQEINSATGVLPFSIEAVIASRNARWTEREVHSRLTGKRVRENREFFRIPVEDARKIVFDVARNQRQKAYGAAAWRGQGSLTTAALLALSILAPSWAIDARLAWIWAAACLAATILHKPKFVHEYLTMRVGGISAGVMMAAGVGTSMLISPDWMREAAQMADALADAF